MSMTKNEEFSEVLRVYGDLAYRMAFQLTRGREDEARDLVQDGFIKIWRFWPFQQPRSFKGWMYRILHNLYMDKLRRKHRQVETSLDAAQDEGLLSLEHHLPDSAPTPEQASEASHRQRAVSRALAGLELDLRMPVVLCDMEGLSYEEIARIVGCPIGTVRSRIHRGRSRLREALVHLEEPTLTRGGYRPTLPLPKGEGLGVRGDLR